MASKKLLKQQPIRVKDDRTQRVDSFQNSGTDRASRRLHKKSYSE